MESALNVALSGQIALERRLATIAQNVANLGTVGYRADEVKFEEVLARTASDTVAFASAGEEYVSRRAGPLLRTDNQLDVAVQGEGWLAIETPGGVAYTRDGRLRMPETGELTTINGYRVLDVGGAPIALDPNGGPPTIARDGMITQGGQQIGAIGLFRIDENANLTRFENSGIFTDARPEEVLDFGTNGIVQGFVEGSNVNPVAEITRLITVSRAFDSAAALVTDTQSTLQGLIQTLGTTS
jgi:flagellar basal-body rod protein FlgF